ncbi:hypothetical protein FRC07_003931, partial [Ceratobasidium sp. 392]
MYKLIKYKTQGQADVNGGRLNIFGSIGDNPQIRRFLEEFAELMESLDVPPAEDDQEASKKILELEHLVLSLPDDSVKMFLLLGFTDISRAQVHRRKRHDDLERAIKYGEHALLLIPEGNPLTTKQLTILGSLYILRFMRLNQASDLDEAIQYQTRAVQLTLDHEPNILQKLASLGSAYQHRFSLFKSSKDSDKAIECCEKITLLSDATASHLPNCLGVLSQLYHNRFELFKLAEDLEKAFEYQKQAISLTRDNDPSWHTKTAELGNLFMSRFQFTNQPSDIDKAIKHYADSLSSCPEDHHCRPVHADKLSNTLASRFSHFGELQDLSAAIDHQKQALSMIRESETRSTHLSALGHLCRIKFEQTGVMEDIDNAVSYHKQASILIPDNHPEKPSILDGLGAAYQVRSQDLRDVTDIEKAITYREEALLLATGHGQIQPHPGQLHNLGTSYLVRFNHSKDLRDLDKSIDYQKKALLLLSGSSAEKPVFLGHLGRALMTRFSCLGRGEDAVEAIKYQEAGVLLTPDGHIRQPEELSGLGLSCRIKYESLREPKDLDSAIDYMQQAVLLTPNNHPELSLRLGRLIEPCYYRYQSTGDRNNLECAFMWAQLTTRVKWGAPHSRFAAARHWANLAHHLDDFRPLDAYKASMTLIPEFVWLGAPVHRQYHELASVIHGYFVRAVASANYEHQHSLAFEWLEQGRSIVWNQLLKLRTPFDELHTVDPGMAQELKRVAHILQRSLSLSERRETLLRGLDPEPAAQRHRRAAERWEELVEKARCLPGLSNYLQPKAFAELRLAAKSRSIIAVNVFGRFASAMAVVPGSTAPIHIALPRFTVKKAADAHRILLGSLKGFLARRYSERRPKYNPESTHNHKDYFLAILSMLWTDVVQPILDRLGYLQPGSSQEDLPHVTWCATGPISFLPLHAAGCYGDSQPRARCFDYVISSYTPNFGVLLRPDRPWSDFRGILAVGQAAPGSNAPLPGTVAELDRAQEQAGGIRFTRLAGDQATANAVLDAMKEHSWVHLACHALQNIADPTTSAFQLSHSELSLAKITDEALPHADFAFLSACETATGDEKLPDEAIHLAGGMIMAGYLSVVATMWSIQDQDAPLVAENVYKHMLEGGIADSRRAARALHKAVGHLRDQICENEFARWIP